MDGWLLHASMVQRRRRRADWHPHHGDTPYLCHPSSARWLETSSLMAATTTTMDETAVRARQRLEEKLGCLPSSSRRRTVQVNSSGGSNIIAEKMNAWLCSRLRGKCWFSELRNSEADRQQICVVCLEDFEEEQQVIYLPCSHKYHTNCLLPWLAAHPYCPCCRTPVQPDIPN
ncbi:unnamed protein product [Ilex paraguariensis]|uniref:RING-type domain-containing protein n=1 Tax=Ilex paraguariensis TaxID=185542 RepID=A0ABC8RAM8_9AQUA